MLLEGVIESPDLPEPGLAYVLVKNYTRRV